MLRWFDSLHFSSTGFLQQRYPGSAGVFAGFPGRSPSRTCAGSTSGSSSLPIPTGPAVGAGSDQLVFGCWLKFSPVLLPNIAGRSGLFFARYGTVDQVGVYLEQDGSLARLVVIAFGFWDGSAHVGSREILRSTSFSLLDWVFLEIGATIGPSGKVFARLNGIEDARVEFVATDAAVPGQGWSNVRLTPSSGGAGALLLAECYLLDGVVDDAGLRFTKPLGPIDASRQLPFPPTDDGWAPDGDGKFDIVVIAGEINANGRGTGTTGRWRNPNTKVPIWEKRQGSAAFRALEAGVNTFGFFLPANQPFWGPEMRLAEMIAATHEKGSASAPRVRLLKFCQDTSTVGPFPGQEEFSWDPNAIGGLFQLSMAELSAAVASLGGWSQVGRVHWMWIQGEREGSYGLSYEQIISRTNALFAAVDAACDAPVLFSRLLPSQRLNPQVFPVLERVREAYKSTAMVGGLIEFEDPVLQAGLFFDANSLDDLGRRLYLAWLRGRSLASSVLDFFYLAAVDDNYVHAGAGTLSMTPVAETQTNTHSPVLGLGSFQHTQAPSASTLRTSLGSASVDTSISSSGSWLPSSASKAQILSPDLDQTYSVTAL